MSIVEGVEPTPRAAGIAPGWPSARTDAGFADLVGQSTTPSQTTAAPTPAAATWAAPALPALPGLAGDMTAPEPAASGPLGQAEAAVVTGDEQSMPTLADAPPSAAERLALLPAATPPAALPEPGQRPMPSPPPVFVAVAAQAGSPAHATPPAEPAMTDTTAVAESGESDESDKGAAGMDASDAAPAQHASHEAISIAMVPATSARADVPAAMLATEPVAAAARHMARAESGSSRTAQASPTPDVPAPAAIRQSVMDRPGRLSDQASAAAGDGALPVTTPTIQHAVLPSLGEARPQAPTVEPARVMQAYAQPAPAAVLPPSPKLIAASVATQAANGEREILIRLSPDELGRIEVRLVEGRQGMQATLYATEPKAIEVLGREAPDLRTAFADSGIRLDAVRVEPQFDSGVSTRLSQGQSGAGGQSSGQGGNQGGAFGQAPRDGRPQFGRQAEAQAQQAATGTVEIGIGRVNMVA